MTAQRIRVGGLQFEAMKNGDVMVLVVPVKGVVPHLDTIRLAYWLFKTYVKAAAKRSEGAR